MSNTNRLNQEKSPYLLQHVSNPVDWWAWCEEAFAKAKRENKPIFLSIGYSTCHWCHVMARESFADQQVADLLNQWFISIKVDREERPDIDAIYMRACQALTGSGGWPLTIIMTPEKKPFFAATYIPKSASHGMMGMIELLAQIADKWQNEQQALLAASDDITNFLLKQEKSKPSAMTIEPHEVISLAVHQFKQSFDTTWGGFGRAPKFPAAHNLLFLLQYAEDYHAQDILNIVEHTLISMYRGGIFDHIGGGFARYSTDKKWLIPHFEKMLYDNALLAQAYLAAFRYTKKTIYGEIAKRILDYILREMTDSAGGFYCSQDADSEGIEGKFYAFSYEEVLSVLGKDQGKVFCDFYGITPEGNFEGANIANLLNNPEYEKISPEIIAMRDHLYAYRLSRAALHKDDKILTSWNALMISTMSQAGDILHDSRYLNTAQAAQQFIEHNLSFPDGRLFIRWRDNQAAHSGLLDDYALYCLALLTLYQSTNDKKYLLRATSLAQIMLERFIDHENGGFYLSADDTKPLIMRPKEIYDGAMPSGNSAAALLLIRLAHCTGDKLWQEAAEQQIAFMLPRISQYPVNHGFALLALLERYGNHSY